MLHVYNNSLPSHDQCMINEHKWLICVIAVEVGDAGEQCQWNECYTQVFPVQLYIN